MESLLLSSCMLRLQAPLDLSSSMKVYFVHAGSSYVGHMCPVMAASNGGGDVFLWKHLGATGLTVV